MRPGGQEARRPGQEDGVQEEDPLQEQGRPQPGGAAPGGGGGHLVQQGQALQGEDQQPSRQQCCGSGIEIETITCLCDSPLLVVTGQQIPKA